MLTDGSTMMSIELPVSVHLIYMQNFQNLCNSHIIPWKIQFYDQHDMSQSRLARPPYS